MSTPGKKEPCPECGQISSRHCKTRFTVKGLHGPEKRISYKYLCKNPDCTKRFFTIRNKESKLPIHYTEEVISKVAEYRGMGLTWEGIHTKLWKTYRIRIPVSTMFSWLESEYVE